MTVQVTCLTTALGGRGDEESGDEGWCVPPPLFSHTCSGAISLITPQVPVPPSLLNISPSSHSPLLSSSFSLRLIWGALAAALTHMALIGKKQCGDMLSVPVENSTLNLKQQAPKPGHNTPATWLSWEFGPRPVVQELSRGNDE